MNAYALPTYSFRYGLFAIAMTLVFSASLSAESAGFRQTIDGYPCGYACKTPRPGDEVFMVSTRCLPGGCGWELPVERVQVSQYMPGQGWVSIDWDTFTQSQSPGGLTSVYVHGNWMDTYWAERRGWEMYHEVTRNLSMDQKVRHVMWSWPTQEEPKPLQTVREHAVRADDDAYYLASYLMTIPTDEQVSISAFSLGSRVAMGACHLMAGGALRGRALPEHETNVHGYRVAMFSAGVTYSAIYPTGRNGQALAVIDRMYSAFNSADKILRFYRMASQRKGDEAAGYIGFSLANDQRQKVEQVNAANILGKEHSWDNVVCAFCLMERARDYLQWKEI